MSASRLQRLTDQAESLLQQVGTEAGVDLDAVTRLAQDAAKVCTAKVGREATSAVVALQKKLTRLTSALTGERDEVRSQMGTLGRGQRALGGYGALRSAKQGQRLNRHA